MSAFRPTHAATRGRTAIVTYFGIDGACAAAVAALKLPEAAIRASSANRIAQTLQGMAREAFDVIHVCGVGVYCTWTELQQAARELAEAGTKIIWHCGRGYLDAERKKFEAIATPVFKDGATNTAALAAYFDLDDLLECQFLLELARLDPNLSAQQQFPRMSEEQADWFDLIQAALGQYLKFQDDSVYPEVIGRLARLEMNHRDRSTLKIFRRMGFKYLLHGRSPVIRRLKIRIQRCAEADRPVLITGESGVGKEHVAHLIWEGSNRANGPMVAVNCAYYAGNAQLANADLFGHLKGAFTGAMTARPGKLVAADEGILFLDELSELPLEVQAKLLRVLEDGWVTPVGAERPTTQVNLRLITASNQNLHSLIRQGRFREDLFHRISTLSIQAPPLRNRRDDIPIIVTEHLKQLVEENFVPKLRKDDRELLQAHDWPGNVRQLIKILDRAVMLGISVAEALEEERNLEDADSAPVTTPALQGQYTVASWRLPENPGAIRPIKDIQQAYARHAWELLDHNYAATARALGIQPNTLRYSYLREERPSS